MPSNTTAARCRAVIRHLRAALAHTTNPQDRALLEDHILGWTRKAVYLEEMEKAAAAATRLGLTLI